MKTKSFILAAGAALLLSAASVQGANADNGHHRCGGNSGKGVGNECVTPAEHRAAHTAEVQQRREHRREVHALKRERAAEKKAAWHEHRADERKARDARRAARRHHDVTPVTTGATVTTTTTTGGK